MAQRHGICGDPEQVRFVEEPLLRMRVVDYDLHRTAVQWEVFLLPVIKNRPQYLLHTHTRIDSTTCLLTVRYESLTLRGENKKDVRDLHSQQHMHAVQQYVCSYVR